MGNRTITKNETGKSYIGIHRTLVLMAYIYLAFPMILFLLGWCRPIIGIPLAGVCIWSLIQGFRKRENYIELDWKLSLTDKWKLVIIAAIIFAWVVLSGVGGYVWQNGDHAWRNRILQILVEYEWPPVTAERGLTYYIGTWLPAALVGKVLDLDSAYTTLFLWVLLGVFLVYALICVWRRKIVLWPLVILIFFGGMDVIGSNLFSEDAVSILGFDHLEWWAPRQPYELQYSSNTTQLFWVFNQSVPIWLAVMLLFLDEPPKNILWVSSLTAITSILPFIGLVPILIYYMFRRSEWYRPENVMQGWNTILNNMASFQNFAGGGTVLIISFLYLMGNDNLSILFIDAADGNTAGLSVWFPWIFLLVAAAALLLLGTVAIWVWGKEKGYLLRHILYATAALVLIILFFGNLSTEKAGGNNVYRLVYTILFVLLEAGIYLYLLFRDVEDKGLFNVVAVSLMVIPFIRIGATGDFCMRASIPGLFIVMLWCIEALGKKRKNLRVAILVTCLVIGAVAPVHEIKRTLINSQNDYVIGLVEDERIMNAQNFSGSLATFFWQYLARKK